MEESLFHLKVTSEGGLSLKYLQEASQVVPFPVLMHLPLLYWQTPIFAAVWGMLLES